MPDGCAEIGEFAPPVLEVGAVVSTNANQTVPSPAPNHCTAIQEISTESHSDEAPMSNGVRVSPLPRKLPLLTNQIAQKGSAILNDCKAPVPASITAGSAEKTF